MKKMKVVQEIEEIIQNKKKLYHMVSLLSSQIFQKFKEKERFVNIVLKFNVSKWTIMFKISFSKLRNNYPKIKNYHFTIFRNIWKRLEKFVKQTLVNLNK